MSLILVPLSAWCNARRICSSVCPFFATGVSSSCSSTGPRLPRQTQLIAGSLFRFWVILFEPCDDDEESHEHEQERPVDFLVDFLALNSASEEHHGAGRDS